VVTFLLVGAAIVVMGIIYRRPQQRQQHPGPLRPRLMPGRRSDEDGVIASQLAVLMPALLLLLMLAVQFGLWAHASQLARAAADEAAYIAALPDSTEQPARRPPPGCSPRPATSPTSDHRRPQPDTVVATVTGVAPQVVPGFRWSVSPPPRRRPGRAVHPPRRTMTRWRNEDGSVAVEAAVVAPACWC
jgi:hypothetical protein